MKQAEVMLEAAMDKTDLGSAEKTWDTTDSTTFVTEY